MVFGATTRNSVRELVPLFGKLSEREPLRVQRHAQVLQVVRVLCHVARPGFLAQGEVHVFDGVQGLRAAVGAASHGCIDRVVHHVVVNATVTQ